MKHEWRKHEKDLYLPKNKPQIITIPPLKFFVLEGKGDPNDDFFAEYIGVLYSLAYAVKMSHKKGFAPADYFDYTVYPLEGVWDISGEAKKKYSGKLNKNELVFNLMIRQPNFVTTDFADEIISRTKKNKPHELLENVEFYSMEDGECAQMMHLGSYDDEPVSFSAMENYCTENNYLRASKKHREIYLSDARKVTPEKLKTVLRFEIKEL